MATTVHGVPYPLASDNNDAAGDMQAIAEFLDERMFTPGDIKTSIRTTAQTGWAKVDGTTLSGAQSTYPALWAVAPTSWKSGSNLVLPQWCGGANGTVLRGAATDMTLGATISANTLQLAVANLPDHSHTVNISHTHTGASTQGESGHSHTINHGHNASTTGYEDVRHSHPPDLRTHFIVQTISGGYAANTAVMTGAAQPYGATNSAWTGPSTDHRHGFTVPSYTGSSGPSSGHSHQLNDIALGTTNKSTTQSGMTATAVDTKSRSGGVNFFIRLS